MESQPRMHWQAEEQLPTGIASKNFRGLVGIFPTDTKFSRQLPNFPTAAECYRQLPNFTDKYQFFLRYRNLPTGIPNFADSLFVKCSIEIIVRIHCAKAPLPGRPTLDQAVDAHAM